MSKRYIFLAILLLGSAFGLTRIPEFKAKEQIPVNNMLIKINDQSRYLSTYDVAERIIDKDPSLFLIDVRSENDYSEYTIPGAVNIPLGKIMQPEFRDFIRQEGIDIVFFSNSDLYADQAWMLAAQKGFPNLFVLKGGMNEWFRTILMPEIPPESASSEEFELYSFALGARSYFSGNTLEAPADTREKVTIRRKVKKKAEGGC